MPGGDATGPTGTGAKTGRAAGSCAGSDVPGYMNPGPGRGFWGRGGGRGWRNRYRATGLTGWLWEAMGRPGSASAAAPTREGELDALKRQSGLLEGFLASIRRRIEELESKADNA
jgi:hypothetical protein